MLLACSGRSEQEAKTNTPLRTFAIEALADFRTVGAVAPSSRYLTQAMLGPLPLQKARVIVEVGSGTGVITQALLKSLHVDAVVYAFEINSRFSQYVRSRVADPRLVLINASAERLQKELRYRGHERVDAVISSLALSLMPERQRNGFLSSLAGVLDPAGVFTQYQYFHGMQVENGQLRRFHLVDLLRQHFGSVQRKMILRNLPPAFVFTCRGPLRQGAARAKVWNRFSPSLLGLG